MRPNIKKLTAANIETIAPDSDDCIIFDPTMAGFGLRIRNRKHRTLIAQYKIGNQHRRINLGTVGKVDFEDARKQARKIFGQVADDKDPAEKKPKPHAYSLGIAVTQYLEARRDALKGGTYTAQVRYLNEHWADLHDMPLSGITRADVATILTTIAKDRGPVAANRARAVLSKFFWWAIGEGLCDANPVVGTNVRDENDPRERSLSDMEAAAAWLAAPDSDYGWILKLILLTGCRRAEVGDLKWSEIDFEARTITLPRERTKNHQQHTLPLSEPAMEILNSIPHRDGREYLFGRIGPAGFTNWSMSKEDFDRIVNLKEPWTLHDLRRTVRTGLGKLGVQPHIAEAVLNHLPPKLIRTYDRNTYAAEKRDALDKWAAHLKVAVAQATGANVTALEKKQR